MIFYRFQSLTRKIDAMVIHDLKQNMPVKYWSFRLAELIAKTGMISFICVFVSYFGLGMIMQSSGKNLPEYFIDGCAKAIIALLVISLISAIVRGGLYVDLEKRIMLKWKNIIE